jgi:hypothetical protein
MSAGRELRLRDERLEWRAVAGEIVALDVRDSEYLAVNQSGRRLWEALTLGTNEDELRSILQSTYGLSAEQAGHDVEAFLAELARRDLLAP